MKLSLLKATSFIFASLLVAGGTTSGSPDQAFAVSGGSCTTGSYSETTVGSDNVGIFTAPAGASSTSCSWSVPAGVNGVRVLVVAGGGGGGGYVTGGGGGGGGVVHISGYSVDPGAVLNVEVGKGGIYGSNTYNTPRAVNNGSNGDASSFDSLNALGGGGGGGGGTNSQIGFTGNDGASGGGGGRCWVTCNTNQNVSNGNFHGGGTGTVSQGNDGGKSFYINGAGGGGAGGVGGHSVPGLAGIGGDGIVNDISGANVAYAGGGGGGAETTTTRAAGGTGGGGRGGATNAEDGENGSPDTGGGAGASRTGTAGTGGSGIVVIRWSTTAPSAPSFTLSESSGYGVVNTSVGSLYSVSNTGAAVTKFSISPALPQGMLFDTQTGLISGTPVAIASRATYSVTAIRINNSNGALSKLSRSFEFEVGSTATTTTVPPTTTSTVAPSTTSTSTTTTVAVGQASIATIPSTVPGQTTTTVQTPLVVAKNVVAPLTTSTTSTTIALPVAPSAPAIQPGEAGLIVDGKTESALLKRDNNSLIASGAGISSTIYGQSVTGEKIALDAVGNLRVQRGDKISVESTGYASGTEVQVWMYSTPSQLGVITADSMGKVKQTFALPTDLETGDHRVVLVGKNVANQNVTLGIGISYGEVDGSSLATRLLIIVPVALAILIGLLVPATRRRRRNAVPA